MSVLVYGANGQVGTYLASVDGIVATTRHSADLQRPAECARVIRDLRPQAVINCAGLRGGHPNAANDHLLFCINAASPTAMAEACADISVPFVHISGVDVFDGKLPMPYIPSDKANPTSSFGMARLAAEEGIRTAGGPHAIVRVPLIFDDAMPLVLRGLGLNVQNGELHVPSDCILAPVPARDLAQALLTMAAALKANPDKSGTYHFAGDEDIALSGFAQVVLQHNRMPIRVVPCPQMAGLCPPISLQNARLDCRVTQAVFGLSRPAWRRVITHAARPPMQRQAG